MSFCCLPFTIPLDFQSFSNFNIAYGLPGDLVKSYSDYADLG